MNRDRHGEAGYGYREQFLCIHTDIQASLYYSGCHDSPMVRLESVLREWQCEVVNDRSLPHGEPVSTVLYPKDDFKTSNGENKCGKYLTAVDGSCPF